MINIPSTAVLTAVGITASAILFGTGVTTMRQQNQTGIQADSKVGQIGDSIKNSNITVYDGKIVSGSEVIAALQSLENEDIVIKINNGNAVITYDPNSPAQSNMSKILGEVKMKSSLSYVSEDQMFEGSLTRDYSSGAIKELLFNASTSGGTRNNANFSTDVNSTPITSDTVYVDYYLNNGTNNLFYNNYAAQKGVEDNILNEYPTDAYYQGHEFLGWGTSKGGSKVYDPGQSVTFTSDTNLYAVWATKTYNIEFNANGGSGAPASLKKNWGTNVNVPATTPVRENAEFLGWSRRANSTAIEYKPGDEITTDQDLKLYAVWKTSTYKITFKANGGQGSDYTQPVSAGTTTNLYMCQFTNDINKVFGGWATSSNGDAVYSDGQTIYSLTGDTTLYAVWRTVEKAKLTFNMNGGENGPADTEVAMGTYVIPSIVPDKDGQKFVGWLSSEGATYNSGSSVLVTGDITFTAQWASTVRSYKVRHVFMNTNGEYDLSDSELVVEETRNANTFTVTPNPIYRDGFDDPDESTIKPVNIAADGSTVIEYRYPRKKHKVDFVITDNAAGQIVHTPVKDIYYYGEVINADTQLNPGYAFDRWDSDGEDVTRYHQKDDFTVDDITTEYTSNVHAIEYSITYVLNGGVNGEGNPDKYLMPFSYRINPATKTGYTFKGWSGSNTGKGWGINEDGTPNPHVDNEMTNNDYQFIIPKLQDYHMIFTANFEVNKYKVRFNPNGASGSAYTTGQYIYDKKEAMPENRFSYAEHKFAGWNTRADGTGLDIREIYKLSPDNNAVVDLYAIWTGDPAAEVSESKWINNQTITPGSTASKNPQIYSLSSWNSFGLLRVAIPRINARVESGDMTVQDSVVLAGLNTKDYILLRDFIDGDYHILYYGYNGVIGSYGTTPELFTGITIPKFTEVQGAKTLSVDITAFMCRRSDYKSVQDAYDHGMLN